MIHPHSGKRTQWQLRTRAAQSAWHKLAQRPDCHTSSVTLLSRVAACYHYVKQWFVTRYVWLCSQYAVLCSPAILPAPLARWVQHTIVTGLALFIIVGEMYLSWSHHAYESPPLHQHIAMRMQPIDRYQGTGDTVSLIAPFTLVNAPNRMIIKVKHVPTEPLAPALQAPVMDLTPAFHEETYRLAPGETLGNVANRYSITLASLIWANGLQNGDVLMIGQELRIPRISGLPYVIQAGDTLDGIAARFGVPAEIIVAFQPDHLALDAPLPVGHEIFVPGGVQPLPETLLALRGGEEGLAASTSQPAGIVRNNETNVREGPDTVYERTAQVAAGRRAQLLGRHADWVQIDVAGVSGWVHRDLLIIGDGVLDMVPETNNFPPPPPIWVWPTYGAFTSPFGPRWGGFHNGIDIANRAWTPIVAARTGRVTEAGWCSGYGYCVKMRHDGGFGTIYGHLIDHPVVHAGESVQAGTVIGYMGSTYDRSGGGFSTGNHLHFTITMNGRAVNPLTFLP